MGTSTSTFRCKQCNSSGKHYNMCPYYRNPSNNTGDFHSVRCHQCKNEGATNMVNVNGILIYYHLRCMRCFRCRNPIKNLNYHIDRKDQILCAGCPER